MAQKKFHSYHLNVLRYFSTFTITNASKINHKVSFQFQFKTNIYIAFIYYYVIKMHKRQKESQRVFANLQTLQPIRIFLGQLFDNDFGETLTIKVVT